MKLHRAPLAALMILTASLAVACAGETPAESSASDEGDAVEAASGDSDEAKSTADEAAPRARPERHPGGKGKDWSKDGDTGDGGPRDGGARAAKGRGAMGVIISAVRELDLTEEQKAKLAELRRNVADGAERPNDGALVKALAGAVEAGQVDVAAFDAELDAIETHAAEQSAAMRTALDTMHDTLTPEQRAELVSVLRDRIERMKERAPGLGKPGKAGKGKGKAGKGKAGKGKAGHGRAGQGEAGAGPSVLGLLDRQLDLTDAQKAELETLRDDLVEDRPERDRRADIEALLGSFASDDFDAAALPFADSAGKTARAHAEHMITAMSKVVPILDETQRSKLARMLEKRMGGERGKRARKAN